MEPVVFWLIWYQYQRYYVFVYYPLCVVVDVVWTLLLASFGHRNLIFCLQMHICHCAQELLGQCDIYFSNGSHFFFYPIIASPAHIEEEEFV